ncbi:hypothetical protein AJ79_05439 [Helicocarpus griseus UAMH5409]|uniref:Glycosyl hydrolase family 32 N-terminal domain-containing protein n=1 Tax=Helicocarpus griseus UAMH5409 TaxID=1447875 RepID=A0A2B7XP26_9EURO|nr:hypothetical protein AJ79_05439 [Helicocarpus griseus UAMH5409]
MLISTVLLFAILIMGTVSAQSDYDGLLRPQVHFSPRTNFINDPNGMFRDSDGLWHLYYQYNPTGLTAGNQHWGHATSKDLYQWENHPVAIAPENPGFEAIFSGCVVVDENNTSGFFPDQRNGVVAIYTLHTDKEETQDIAYSTDGGYTFTKYAHNPVLSIGSTQFRDPKVFWHPQTQKWVMPIAYAEELVIGFYTSVDLKTWQHASNFSHEKLVGTQFECPNLMQVPVQDSGEILDVLLISVNPGAPLGGSITQYLTGHFDGTSFVPIDTQERFTDFAKDNYATQIFYGTPAGKSPISMAWANNWEYAQEVPTGELEGWRSAMSLPREHSLKDIAGFGYMLLSSPYNIETVRDTSLARCSLRRNSLSLDYSQVASKALYFEVTIQDIPDTGATGTLNFDFKSTSSGETLKGEISVADNDRHFFIDRGGVRGFSSPSFTPRFTTPVPYFEGNRFHFSVAIDRSILEVFLNYGEQSATVVFYPLESLDQLTVSARDLNEHVTADIEVWGLQSTWSVD